MDINTHTVINQKFLERILLKPLKSLTVTSGSRPGDNFTSILFSIEAVLEDDENPKYLLMKTYPTHPVRQKFLEDTNLFLKELFVYQVLIPEYLKFQEIKNKIILKPAVPPFIYGRAVDYCNDNKVTKKIEPEIEKVSSEKDAENFLLMVDIRKTFNFKMADKFLGLDVNHCKLVITELAKLHSISLAYKNHHGLKRLSDRFPLLEEAIFTSQKSEIIVPMIKGNFKLVSESVEKSLGKDHPAILSINKLGKNPIEVLTTFLNPDGVDEQEADKLMRVKPLSTVLCSESNWVVGNHGDCWINNMLFKYDEQTNDPIEAMLVDLQLCRESCLTVDLVYFFYSSTDHHLRLNHLDELLQVYYDSFISYCKVLNTAAFHGFTFENLKSRFHRSKILGFLFSVLVLPIILQKPENSMDLDDVRPTNDKNEEYFFELIQSMPRNESDDKLMEIRFLGMVHELFDEGVL